MSKTFEEAHPELKDCVNKHFGSVDGLNLYQNFKGSKVIEQWERDKDGNLVDVTSRVRAEQELEEARKALKKLLEEGDKPCQRDILPSRLW